MTDESWIAVDWGTSRLRAFRMQGARSVAERASEDGMGALARDAFEPALIRVLGDWLGDAPVRVIACGMVGSRQGWVEAAYAAVPTAPMSSTLARPKTQDRRLDVYVVPGLKQTDPADVMRGEETQIAGYLAQTSDFDGVICLPGSHAKWVQISAGEVVSFRTAMTGEMFAALSGHTVLRHTVHGDGWDDDAFDAAVADALSRPEALAVRLFALRAEALLQDLDAGSARARLSGLLIGAELAALRPYWLGQQIALIGASRLSALYARALTAQGARPQIVDATAATVSGLVAARTLIDGASR